MGKNGIAIEFFFHPYSGEKMIVHLQTLGYDLGLINSTRPAFAHIHLLQGHDIRMVLGDDPGNTLRRHHSIHTQTAVDIVRHDAQGLLPGRPQGARHPSSLRLVEDATGGVTQVMGTQILPPSLR